MAGCVSKGTDGALVPVNIASARYGKCWNSIHLRILVKQYIKLLLNLTLYEIAQFCLQFNDSFYNLQVE